MADEQGASGRFGVLFRPYRGRIEFHAESPTTISPLVAEPSERLTDEERQIAERVSATGRAYRRAMRVLLEGSYREHAEIFPTFLRAQGDVYYMFCDDGVVVRHERTPEGRTPTGHIARIAGPLEYVLPGVTDAFLLCTRDGAVYGGESPGIEMALTKAEPGAAPVPIGQRCRVFVPVDLTVGPESNGRRPNPLASVSSTITTEFRGALLNEAGKESRRHFVLNTVMRLPVVWDCIEVFPRETYGLWDPDRAAAWAEDDARAMLVRHHVERSQRLKLDPNADTRSKHAAVLAEFESLLEGPEEPIQRFLASNPYLLVPGHTNVWPKLELGNHVTDFVFREPGDRYVLVEIERPGRRLFRKDGQQTQELTHAISQTVDWLRYLGDNVRTVREELGLKNIQARVPCLVVMGRNRDLAPDMRKKLNVICENGPRVVTYDDLIEASRAAIEHVVGPLWGLSPNSSVYYLPEK